MSSKLGEALHIVQIVSIKNAFFILGYFRGEKRILIFNIILFSHIYFYFNININIQEWTLHYRSICILPFSFLSRTKVLDWQNNAEKIIHAVADNLLLSSIELQSLCTSSININEGLITRTIPTTLATILIRCEASISSLNIE